MPEPVVVEGFSADERRALEPYFTNLDGPVFALRNLPEVVKAALFARYSRSPKSLRRLFLDEFLDTAGGGLGEASVGVRRSEQLFQRVLADYGDDSVAQLGGAHLAVEGASNLLTKALEWGRLMAYLEQSTRYIPYTQRDGGAWRYVVPAELVLKNSGYCEAMVDFDVPYKGPFNQTYMRSLFDYGYNKIRGRNAWQKAPPGYVR